MIISQITIQNRLYGKYNIYRSDGKVIEGLSKNELLEKIKEILEEQS